MPHTMTPTLRLHAEQHDGQSAEIGGLRPLARRLATECFVPAADRGGMLDSTCAGNA